MRTIHQHGTARQHAPHAEAPAAPSVPTVGVEARRIAAETAEELAADDGDTWHWPWVLARRLRTVPGIERETDPMSPAIQSAVLQAHQVFGDITLKTDFAEPGCLVAAVIAIWSKVLYAAGEGPLEIAVRRAAAMPIIPQPSIGRTYARLLSVAYHLQEVQGTAPILLPVHRLEAVLGVSARQVCNLINAALRLGHLEMVDPSYRPGHARRLRCHVRPTRLGPRR